MNQTKFVHLLYNICKLENVISWSEDGTIFSINDINNFSNYILPKFFKHNNYQSFVRQLYMYGFSRNTETIIEPNIKEYYCHKYFIRDRDDLLSKIVRKSTNKRNHNEILNNPSDNDKLLSDVEKLKNNQEYIMEYIPYMKKAKIDPLIKDNSTVMSQFSLIKQNHENISDHFYKMIDVINELNSKIYNIEQIVYDILKDMETLNKNKGERLSEIEKLYCERNNIPLNEDTLSKRNDELLGKYADLM